MDRLIDCLDMTVVVDATLNNIQINNCYTYKQPAPIAQLVECPLQGTGGHGFDPGLRHTEVVKNSTSCSSLGTQS